MVGHGLPVKVHINQNAVTEPNQSTSVEVTVNLGILRPPVINHMLMDKVGLVAIEPVGDEDGDVILPSVPRGG